MNRLRTDRGAIGFELLPFLILVFVIGTVLFAQSWAVIDAKLATNSAAREATRTFVEAPAANAVDAHSRAVAAGEDAGAAQSDRGEISVAVVGIATLERCARVTFEARQEISLVALPFVGGAGTMTVRSTHSEIVDPFRDGLDGRVNCVG